MERLYNWLSSPEKSFIRLSITSTSPAAPYCWIPVGYTYRSTTPSVHTHIKHKHLGSSEDQIPACCTQLQFQLNIYLQSYADNTET